MNDLEYNTDIAQGLVPGKIAIQKFGRNADVDAAEDLWSGGGAYTPPTTARVHQLVSGSIQDAGTVAYDSTITTQSRTQLIDTAQDFSAGTVVAVGDVVLNDSTGEHSIVTGVSSAALGILDVVRTYNNAPWKVGDAYRVVQSAGTGAAVVKLALGFDALVDAKSEFLVLNGTTNVPTTRAYVRIDRAYIVGAGSGGVNAGAITLTADTDATVTARIEAGIGQTQMARMTVPGGYDLFVTRIWATLARATSAFTAIADIVLWTEEYAALSASPTGKRSGGYWGVAAAGPGLTADFPVPKRFHEYSDVWLSIDGVSAVDMDVSGGFDGILVRHPHDHSQP